MPLLVPVITGLVGASGIALRDRMLRRDRVNERREALSSATAEVLFVSEWWKARQLAGVSTESTDEAGLRASAKLEEVWENVQATRPPDPPPTAAVWRRLLLVIPLAGWRAAALRVLFYTCLFALSLVVVSTIFKVASPGSSDEALSDDTILLIIFSLPALVLRFLAVSADQHARTRRPSSAA
ncbi:hypothetical protein [Pseudofrankia sp. DC12]|uniref:hypothetical protein n=1 Tax=Pseudofrankia sp. DC12 TaxID=683315 RepID=UPI0018DEB23E|nr:hypothetical protein [Pseudofrankia sp. DC12]